MPKNKQKINMYSCIEHTCKKEDKKQNREKPVKTSIYIHSYTP